MLSRGYVSVDCYIWQSDTSIGRDGLIIYTLPFEHYEIQTNKNGLAQLTCWPALIDIQMAFLIDNGINFQRYIETIYCQPI